MELQHHFTVPVPVEVAWSALLDPERIAPCMPGATLTKAEGNEFAGSVKVKLGPISLLYKGSGSFTQIDAEARRVVVEASGKDTKGNGTASATVTATLTSQDGGTSVTVDTDLKITGKPAQFGRGLISEVGGKLINQFADCLAQRLAESEADNPGTGAAESVEAADDTAARESATGASAASGAEPAVPARPAPEPEPEPIDLLGTAGSPVLKRLVPVLVVLVLGGILFRARRRRRRARG